MSRKHVIGQFLFFGFVAFASAQPVQIATLQNSNLLFAAADLTTNGVAGLTNTAPHLMVSGVAPISVHQGSVSIVNTQAWVRRCGSPFYDVPSQVIVDRMQNVIVTGTLSADFFTVKYASDGTPLWTNRYDGPAHLNDYAYHLAVDDSGNVYVAGTSQAANPAWDAVIIKYSSDGAMLWVSRYNRYGTNNCANAGLAVDAAGNVFAGAGAVYPGDTAFITLKYDPQGNSVWTNYYKGSLGGSDYMGAVAVDNSGNIFVTGDSDGIGTGLNYTTLKYATDGTALWTNRYISGWTAIPSAMALDLDGNVIVTGDSFVPDHVYATVKYSNEGIPLWTNLVPAPNYQGGGVPVMVTDIAGNVFMTGGSPAANDYNSDFTTVKYSPDGAPLWTNRFIEVNSNNPAPGGTAVDSAGNFYFAGHSSGPGGTNVDFVTIKYSATGNAIWTNRYNGLTIDSTDEAEGIAVDHAGNVYVTGLAGGYTGSGDFATVKYSDYIRYTPPTNFTGIDSFTFTVVDALGHSATNTVNVFVLPANLQFNTSSSNLLFDAQGIQLQVDGAHGTNVVIIYASTNLSDWEPIFTNQPDQGSVRFTDCAAKNFPYRFYRATQPH